MEPWKVLMLAAVESATGVRGVEEFRFHTDRRWRFDLAWPALMVAFEREGMARRGGKSRHTTFSGFQADCEKYNTAAILGWRVIRGNVKMISKGTALVAVLDAIKAAQTATNFVKALADRIHKQSELISRKAEK